MWNREFSGDVPSGPVEDEQGMGARPHLGRDFIKMPLHRFGVAAGQDEGSADTASRTDGAEDIGRFGALVHGCRRPGSPFCPAPRQLGFLTDPGFILPPDFYFGAGRERAAQGCQLGWEVFLKSSTANSFCP